MTWLVLIAAATCIQVLVGELFDWFPWIAARLVRQAARCLPKESRARYENEWLGELDAIPGPRISRLFFSLRVLSRAPGTRLELEPKAPRLRNLAGKRLSEVLISSFGLIVVLPVFAICSLLIKIFCGPGPVFSREVRLGTDGDYFLLMRFRTSCAVGVSPLPEIAGESLFDLYYPRFRRFLKHFSLDEIPQFLNVVRGEMSLVGPRPKPLRIMEYPSDLDPYPMQNVKPGIVSWETLVNDREEGRRLDIDYATAWSPRKMTHALLRTCYFGLFNRPL